MMSVDTAPYDDKLYLSWQDIQDDTLKLAKELEAKGPWTGIVAITRGGLIPAGLLSQVMNIKMIDTVCMSSYEYQSQGEMNILKAPDNLGDGAGWLIVDDLVDTGKTFVAARKLFPKGHLSCVYAKPGGQATADSYIREVEQDTWIVFPWELAEN